MKTYSAILSKYIPQAAIDEILEWLESFNAELKITRSRTTKLGDYRPPIKFKYHKISVNHDLNKFQFLITLVHEFAHLCTWNKFKNKVKPHGKEWKEEYKILMEPFLNQTIFPDDMLEVLKKYLVNPASSTSDHALLKILRKYDGPKDYFTLEDLPMNAEFRIHNGFVFKKIEKLRKRFKCKRLDNNRMYLVSPLMKVIPVNVTTQS